MQITNMPQRLPQGMKKFQNIYLKLKKRVSTMRQKFWGSFNKKHKKFNHTKLPLFSGLKPREFCLANFSKALNNFSKGLKHLKTWFQPRSSKISRIKDQVPRIKFQGAVSLQYLWPVLYILITRRSQLILSNGLHSVPLNFDYLKGQPRWPVCSGPLEVGEGVRTCSHVESHVLAHFFCLWCLAVTFPIIN